MDAKIEIYTWDIGYDEVDELANDIADLLARRGYASDPSDEENPIKTIVVAQRTAIEDRPGNTDEEQYEWFQRVTDEAHLIIVPGTLTPKET